MDFPPLSLTLGGINLKAAGVQIALSSTGDWAVDVILVYYWDNLYIDYKYILYFFNFLARRGVWGKQFTHGL
jgi:hypothetical protein